MATMRDVARKAAVSIATVSAVINGTANVSDELRERVLAAIDEVGYAPDSVARSLRTGTSRTLGLVVPDVTNPLFAAVARAVEAAASEAGYAVFLCNTDESLEKQVRYLRLLRAHKTAGIILVPAGERAGDVDEIRKELHAPTVVADRLVPGLDTDIVAVDNFVGARRAVAHLAGLGHRRIAAILGLRHTSPTQDRLKGYLAAMAAHGIAEDPRLIRADCRNSEVAFDAACAMLSSAEPPTAIFASNDMVGLGTLHAIVEMGRQCPEEVSFCCFDGFGWAEAVSPQVTTVQQPMDQLGAMAVQLLLDRIAGKSTAPRRIVLPTEFILRDSCAASPDTAGMTRVL